MVAKHIAAALIGSALLSTAALAQTPTATNAPASARVVASDSTFNGDWRASKVVGLNVYNDSNESLGSINDLLLDKTGSIKGVVVGVGGFLGVGEHLVAVNFDKIKFVDEPVVTTSAANSSTTGSSGMTGTNPSTTSNGMTTGSAPATPAASRSNPWYPDHAVLSTTKDELKAMPEFKYSTQ
jgi:sporulation protein YlmC with PRC-barrel domain